jgi:tRNA(fMet)-specific endonuclease VapC
LLDTSIVIAVFGRVAVAQRLVDDADEIALPVPALGELYVGVPRSPRPDLTLAQITAFLATTPVLPCDDATAKIYGEIHSALLAKRRPLPQNDVWIAAIARQHGLTVATRDAHFEQISGIGIARV